MSDLPQSEQVLDLVRPLVLTIDSLGTVKSIRGGYGGFFGLDLPQLVGRSVFDQIDPAQADELATYFIESGDASFGSVALPMAFRVSLIGGDGRFHPVDVIPTGHETSNGEVLWVAVVVPVSILVSASMSLDAEIAGAPRSEVRRLLAAELAVDNEHFSTRTFLVEFANGAATVIAADAEHQPVVDAASTAITGGWAPWVGIDPSVTVPLVVADMPRLIAQELHERGWRRASVTPVHVDGELVGAYLLFGRVSDDYRVDFVHTNVMRRIGALVNVTALLFERWRDSDRLAQAALRDTLTGLANRLAFIAAMESAVGESVVLYLDVDHFKAVNDDLGHDAGDQMLVEVAMRLVAACRPIDTVARLGGDEFVVLLPHTDVAVATLIAQRIIQRVQEPMTIAGAERVVTVSLGLAATGAGAVDEAILHADRAMLLAKREGRGRIATSNVSWRDGESVGNEGGAP